MAANLNDLVPEFRKKIERLLTNCSKRDVEMRPYFTLRTPFEQAKLWRQSRSREQIQAKITELKAAGADFLAYCIESVGPQNGPPVTNAPPGYSWHQWGEAVDSFWVVGGTAEWSSAKKIEGVNGYQVYAEEASNLGLDAGGLWKSLKDWPHVQLRPAGSPAKVLSLVEINSEMKKRFGG